MQIHTEAYKPETSVCSFSNFILTLALIKYISVGQSSDDILQLYHLTFNKRKGQFRYSDKKKKGRKEKTT